jgi:hypothetical protein
MSKKNPDLEALAEAIRKEFTVPDFEKGLDLISFVQTVHMRESGCAGPNSGCGVSQAVHLVGKFLGELLQMAYPGAAEAYMARTQAELEAQVGSTEGVKELIDRAPFTQEVKDVMKKTVEEISQSSVGAAFTTAPSKMVH